MSFLNDGKWWIPWLLRQIALQYWHPFLIQMKMQPRNIERWVGHYRAVRWYGPTARRVTITCCCTRSNPWKGETRCCHCIGRHLDVFGGCIKHCIAVDHNDYYDYTVCFFAGIYYLKLFISQVSKKIFHEITWHLLKIFRSIYIVENFIDAIWCP